MNFQEFWLPIAHKSFVVLGVIVSVSVLVEWFSHSSWSANFQRYAFGSKLSSILVSITSGLLPGCFGSFVLTSFFQRGVIPFSVLLAGMIATTGDEVFVMLALIPTEAVMLHIILALLAVIVATFLSKRLNIASEALPIDSGTDHSHQPLIKSNWPYFAHTIIIGYLMVMLFADFDHLLHFDHLLSALSGVIALWVLFRLGNKKALHISRNVLGYHFLKLAGWTVGSFAISEWLSTMPQFIELYQSSYLFALIAAVFIGFLPQSGPHIIFITLFAKGVSPFSVLLASSIVQDGHGLLPLFSSSPRNFFKVKIIKAIIALAITIPLLYLGY